MSKYLLLIPDEDGNPLRWLDSEEVKNIEQLKEDYGIERFLTQEDLNKEDDPNSWEEGDAMLLEIKIKKVVPVEVVTKYEVK